jgi:hypothetical protein
MDWVAYSQLSLRRVVGQRVLVVSLQVDELTLVALETTKPAGELGEVEHVLASHAHQLIGKMPDLQTAIAVAERFVEEWGSGTPLALCQCGSVVQ